MPEPGEVLGKSYRILEVLTGGMGEVFICEWITPPRGSESPELETEPRRIALKTFRRKYFFDHAVRHSFIREASSWLRLAGLPHIMPVLGIETIDDRPFVLMPAVTPGPLGERNLADLVDRGSLDPGLALDYAFQLAIALREASKRISGIVHGDLKPSNVLLSSGDAYLADFGLVSAAALGRPDLRLEGTWAYRAPELWSENPRPPSVASDVYAFGVLLYELLAGALPFNVADHDRDGWQAAHQVQQPPVPASYPSDGMPAAILALALACLAKDPSDRPNDFSKIFNNINHLYKEFDISRQFKQFVKAHVWLQLEEQLPEWREQRIRSLLEIDEPGQALEELDAIPEDEYDATLRMRRGTALSLLNRDEEALASFDRALTGNLSPLDRDNCESELALSLKRLGRFDEARAVYERLLVRVPEDRLALVVVNLATVYLQQKDGAKAVRLLEPFVRQNPDMALAWANLGQAYVFVGRYSEAENAYGRALRLAPQLGQVRVMLAALYMDHLGRLEGAWSALDTAFDSGHESREWIVRMLACSFLLDKRDTLAGLAIGLHDNFPPDLAQRIREEGIAMAQKLAKEYTERAAGEAPEERSPVDPEASSIARDNDAGSETVVAEDSPVFPATDPSPVAPEQRERYGLGIMAPYIQAAKRILVANSSLQPLRRLVAGITGYIPGLFTSVRGRTQRGSTRPGLPFLNFRFYDSQDFTLDYYDSPNSEGFVERFLTEWRRAVRNPQFSQTPLRGTPFYFTSCKGCSVHILTNRDIGKRLNCRMCDTVEPTVPLFGSPFDQLLERVSDAMGVVRVDTDSVHVLFVQPLQKAGLEAIRETCTRAGMTEIERDRRLSVFMIREAMKRLVAKYDQPWTVWILTQSDIESWIHDATPKVISVVVRELQDRVPGVRTLSITQPAETVAEMGESVYDLKKREEQALRERIRNGVAEAADFRRLAVNLNHHKQFVESEQMARAALGADEDSAESWDILGQSLLHQKQYQPACEAFERAIALDPTSVLTLLALAACYTELGDTIRSNDFYEKARSRSGGEFLFSKDDVQ